jgi:hypothetical protein
MLTLRKTGTIYQVLDQKAKTAQLQKQTTINQVVKTHTKDYGYD